MLLLPVALTELKMVLTGGPFRDECPEGAVVFPNRGLLLPEFERSRSSSAMARRRSARGGTGIFCASRSGVFIFSNVSKIVLAVDEMGGAAAAAAEVEEASEVGEGSLEGTEAATAAAAWGTLLPPPPSVGPPPVLLLWLTAVALGRDRFGLDLV